MTLYNFSRILSIFVLVLLCFFASFIVKLHYNKGDYLNEIIHFLNGNVEINGDVSINFFEIGLRVTSLTLVQHLSNSASGFEKIDVRFKLKSLIFGKPEISKITLKNGEISSGDIDRFLSAQPSCLYFENVLLIIPKYGIHTVIRKGSYKKTEKETLFSGEIAHSGEISYKTLINLQKAKDAFSLKLSSKEDKLEILLSKEKNYIVGNGKNLLNLISSFSSVIHDENINGYFSISSNQKDKNTCIVEIDSDLMKSKVTFLKNEKRDKVLINSSYIDLSRIHLSSLERSFIQLLNIQRLFFNNVEINFISPKISFTKDASIGLQFNFADEKDFSYIKDFSAQLESGIVNAKGIIQRKWEKTPTLEMNISYSGTLPKEMLINELSEYYAGITKFNNKKLETSFKIIVGPSMFIISNANAVIGDTKIYWAIQYNKLLKKIRGHLKLASLQLEDLNTDKLTIINLKKLFHSLGEHNTSIQLLLEDIDFKKIKVSHMGLIHHTHNKNNLSQIDVDSEAFRFRGRANFNQSMNNLEINIDGDELDESIITFPKIFEVIKLGDKDYKIQWNEDIFPTIDNTFYGKFDIQFKRVFDKKMTENPFKVVFLSNIKEGVLQIQKLSIKQKELLLELVANVILQEGAKTVMASLSANNLDFGELFKKHLKIAYINGKGDIHGNLSSRGSSISQMVKNLAGNLTFNSSRTYLDGGDIDILSTSLGKVHSMKELDEITRIAFFQNRTPLSEIKGSSNIIDGIFGSSVSFVTRTASGILSSNLNLVELKNSSIARVFFNIHNNPIGVDINIEGSLWKPRIFFDNHVLFTSLKGKKSSSQ